ncbi:MAG: DUF1611 domain-containing protein [Alphaproteobacteria bacterium]|nr:DUF1611 domain-containing protein [Alphaproteobacteria bacterium]
MSRHFASVTRIADFARDWEAIPIPRESWRRGDYVLVRALDRNEPTRFIERADGRRVEIDAGDEIVGALGDRAATLELCGTFDAVGDDLRIDVMTGGGLLAKLTSGSPFIGSPQHTVYVGHVHVDGEPYNMADCVPEPPHATFDTPVVLIIGSSMSSGKTATGRAIVRRLVERGLRVGAAKLTGAARYRDVLSMGDAGASVIYDFVDAGLPSTVCPRPVFEVAAKGLLARLAADDLDVVVIEAGASPSEPYNGDVAMELLDPHVKALVLCASDPYAVVGICHAFGRQADLVAGIATNTEAGRALVRKLTGIEALPLVLTESHPALDAFLERQLGL